MNRKLEFVKAVASGNDFIIIDRCKHPTSDIGHPTTKLTQELCQRRLSVGADGLLLLEPSPKADLKMRIFNPDGTEVGMCGNGARCAALYAQQSKITKKRKMVIETRAGDLQAEVTEDTVKLKMTEPKDLKIDFDLDVNGHRQKVNYINTGVPHIVCFVPGLDELNVQELGRAIRYHSEFQPEGTNVNFVQVLDKNRIKIRTYERGVEQETLACGTGCVAGSIISTYQMSHQPKAGPHKVRVGTRGGDTVAVYFKLSKDKIADVYLEGKAKIVYKGVL